MFEIESGIPLSPHPQSKEGRAAYYQRNKEKWRKYRAKRTQENPEWHKQWRDANKDKIKAQKERSRYGATSVELLKQQNFCCACCGDPLDCGKNTHLDHKGQIVRGVVCRWCNTGLGMFKDDSVRLQKAILYLSKQSQVN